MALTNDKPSDKVTQPDEPETVEGPKGLWNKILWVQTHATQVAKTGRMDGKTKDGRPIKYSFMQEHSFIELLQPKLAEAGLLVLVDVESASRNGNSVSIMGRVQIIDVDTGEKTVQSIPAEGVDTGDKATVKALTQLTKYALQKTFLVATEKIDDSDNDASDSNPRIPEPTDKPLTDEQRQRVTQTLLALDEKKRGLVLAAAGVEGEPSTVGQAFKIRELLDADA